MCVSGSVFWILIWIRIHKAPEYGSNTDPDPVPDPQHCFLRNKCEQLFVHNDLKFCILFVQDDLPNNFEKSLFCNHFLQSLFTWSNLTFHNGVFGLSCRTLWFLTISYNFIMQWFWATLCTRWFTNKIFTCVEYWLLPL